MSDLFIIEKSKNALYLCDIQARASECVDFRVYTKIRGFNGTDV